MKKQKKAENSGAAYTEAEKKIILDNYLEMSNEELAAKLKRPLAGIENMLRRMALFRPLPKQESIDTTGMSFEARREYFREKNSFYISILRRGQGRNR